MTNYFIKHTVKTNNCCNFLLVDVNLYLDKYSKIIETIRSLAVTLTVVHGAPGRSSVMMVMMIGFRMSGAMGC